jgi:hypothetical protein
MRNEKLNIGGPSYAIHSKYFKTFLKIQRVYFSQLVFSSVFLVDFCVCPCFFVYLGYDIIGSQTVSTADPYMGTWGARTALDRVHWDSPEYRTYVQVYVGSSLEIIT